MHVRWASSSAGPKKLLEQGRGILSFLPDAFADSLNELRREHPRLFMKFDQCRQSILVTFNSRDPAKQEDLKAKSPDGSNDEDDVDRLSSILTEIRQKTKFKNFYRPIAAAEMQSLATKGPIVVLVGSSLLPYAVIVRQESIQIVDLSPEAVDPSPYWDVDSFRHLSVSILNPILGRRVVGLEVSADEQVSIQIKASDNMARARSLRGLLNFLWYAVVEPINKVLKFGAPQGRTLSDSVTSSWKNRITWVRTGNLNRMPVHVATDDQNIPFLSRAISSYVGSFQSLSLSHSRHKAAHRELENGLLVTMPSVSASSEIKSFPKDWPFLNAKNVEEEVSTITENASNINWSVLERPSAEHVKSRFSDAAFIHFIYHRG